MIPKLALGGAEVVGLNLAQYLLSCGHIVSVIVLKSGGIPIEQVKARWPRINSVVSLDSASSLRSIGKLKRHFDRNTYDVCLPVIRDANLAASLALRFGGRCKLVMREANTLDEVGVGRSRVYKALYRGLMRVLYPTCDALIANSADTASDLRKGKVLAKSKIHVIGNPVFFEKQIDRSCDGGAEIVRRTTEPYRILTVGRLCEQKNQKQLLKNFVKVRGTIPDCVLRIVGDGPLLAELKNLAVSLGVEENVEFLSSTTNVYPHFLAADLFALTSKWEGFGNVVVEALYFELPVVAYDCPGGVSDILRGGIVGTLVQAGQHQRFVDEVIGALTTKHRQSEGTLRKSRALDFSVENIGKRYEKVLLTVLGSQVSGGH